MKKILFALSLLLLLGCGGKSIEKNAEARLSYILENEWSQNNEGELITENINVVYHHPSDSLVVISFDGYLKGDAQNKETLRYVYYIQKDGAYEAFTDKEIEDRSKWVRFTKPNTDKEGSDRLIDSFIRSSASLIIADRGRKVE